MPGGASFFTRLIENGQFKVDEEGHAILNGEFLLMVPPPVIIHMQQRLADQIGEAAMEDFMADAGRYQVEQAIERYIERYDIDQLSKDHIIEFAEELLRVLGWGRITINQFDVQEHAVRVIVRHPTLPSVHRNQLGERSETPICHYLRGILERGMGAVMENDLDLVETSCAAVDDDTCVFENRATG